MRDLDRAKSSRDPGHDLGTARRRMTGQALLDERTGASLLVDLDTYEGVDNLVQALLLRFLTPAGELTILGHSDYGSRLHELIGELNSEANRNRAKLFVLQALALEPRIKEVISVQVTQNVNLGNQMDIKISVVAIDSDSPLNLVFTFLV